MTHLFETGSCFLAFGLPGHGEWIVLLVLGLLIFGRRLPEVGRSLGRSIIEFKKGIKGIEVDIEEESSAPAKKIENKPSQHIGDQDATIGSPRQDDAKAAVGSGGGEAETS